MPRPRIPKKLALIALPLLAITGITAWAEKTGWLYHYVPALIPPGIHLGNDEGIPLLRVSDGDTMAVRYHEMALSLRLLCVDTEESVHRDATRNSNFGAATSAWAKSYLNSVTVRVDFQQKNWRIETDQYGRALAWLWIVRGEPGPDDDELYNETLIRLGLSPYVTTYGTGGIHHQRLLAAEHEARQAKRGIWAQ